jgi:hypothetical protein
MIHLSSENMNFNGWLGSRFEIGLDRVTTVRQDELKVALYAGFDGPAEG